MAERDQHAPSPPPSEEPTRPVAEQAPAFDARAVHESVQARYPNILGALANDEGWGGSTGPRCLDCLDTGWAFIPHSDEARMRCYCVEYQDPPQYRPPPYYTLPEPTVAAYYRTMTGGVHQFQMPILWNSVTERRQ